VPKNVCTNKYKWSKWWNVSCEQAKEKFTNLKKYNRVMCIENLIELKKTKANFRRVVIKAKEESWRKFLDSLDFRKPSSNVFIFIKSMMSTPPTCSIPPLYSNGYVLVKDDEKANTGLECCWSS